MYCKWQVWGFVFLSDFQPFQGKRQWNAYWLAKEKILTGKASISFAFQIRVQELCESWGGRPGLSVLMSLTVSVDVKQHWTVLQHWSQFVPNMSTDIQGHGALHHHQPFKCIPSTQLQGDISLRPKPWLHFSFISRCMKIETSAANYTALCSAEFWSCVHTCTHVVLCHWLGVSIKNTLIIIVFMITHTHKRYGQLCFE